VGQTALDAKVKINGVDVESATNKMVDAVEGVTLQLNQVTTAPS
jgi:flagellar capping protein FliD